MSSKTNMLRLIKLIDNIIILLKRMPKTLEIFSSLFIFADSSISLSLVTGRVSLSFSSIHNLVNDVADIKVEKLRKKRHLYIIEEKTNILYIYILQIKCN